VCRRESTAEEEVLLPKEYAEAGKASLFFLRLCPTPKFHQSSFGTEEVNVGCE
jgi:hypothetical protein